jgi:hypothetical protein
MPFETTSFAREWPERSPPRDLSDRQAASSTSPHGQRPPPPHEAQLDGRSGDSGRTGAGDAEPALPRCARRLARCLARRTRSLCHLTGLRSPRPTSATITPTARRRRTSIASAHRARGPRRAAAKQSARRRSERSATASHPPSADIRRYPAPLPHRTCCWYRIGPATRRSLRCAEPAAVPGCGIGGRVLIVIRRSDPHYGARVSVPVAG